MIGGLNFYSPQFRIGGLATGLDTDQIIKQLMQAERIPLDRMLQKKEKTEWIRDEYRNIINLLRGLKDEYFNIVKFDNYMFSEANYKKFTATSSDSSYVTATANYQASAGSHKVVVKKLATADTAVSSGKVTKALSGDPSKYNLSGKSIKISLDGVTREIYLDNYKDLDDMINKSGTGLQDLINKSFGEGKIIVENSGGKLTFREAGGASSISLFKGSKNDALKDMGFESGASNRINISKTLEDLAKDFASELTFNKEGNLVFSINSKSFTFSKTTTLSSMLNTINRDADAGVNISYDEISDKFIIVAKQTGDGDNIRIDQTGGTFFTQDGKAGAAGIDTANPVDTANGGQQGRDAIIEIDGQVITRSSNTFTINGITYTVHKEHPENSDGETISVTQDVDGVFHIIKSFIEKYNEVIDKINAKLSEKYDRNYQPLTSDQKEAMSEDEIKKWEEKAKTGLLRNDPILQNILYGMRRALTEKVEGVGITLSSIGITTGSYTEKGKLKIDETKLKEAIKNDIDSVMNLFSKKSSIDSNIDITSEERAIRYKEEGLAYRLFDIIEDNIRTFRDKNNKKGLLLEKAGIEGDTTEFTSLLYKEIRDYENRIAELNIKLIEKENNYYKKFTALERAIAQMNSQSNWLAMQFNWGS
ncbi:MAG TPA: flagellar filament capping protein FliD [Clostridiaceae bacterium]|nr:flagellar filament capping protein FliD [Clostridiaceae bacterium]